MRPHLIDSILAPIHSAQPRELIDSILATKTVAHPRAALYTINRETHQAVRETQKEAERCFTRYTSGRVKPFWEGACSPPPPPSPSLPLSSSLPASLFLLPSLATSLEWGAHPRAVRRAFRGRVVGSHLHPTPPVESKTGMQFSQLFTLMTQFKGVAQ